MCYHLIRGLGRAPGYNIGLPHVLVLLGLAADRPGDHLVGARRAGPILRTLALLAVLILSLPVGVVGVEQSLHLSFAPGREHSPGVGVAFVPLGLAWAASMIVSMVVAAFILMRSLLRRGAAAVNGRPVPEFPKLGPTAMPNIRCLATLVLLAGLQSVSACARPASMSEIYGDYTYRSGRNHASLAINRDHTYRVCHHDKCQSDTFYLEGVTSDGEIRLGFRGEPMASFMESMGDGVQTGYKDGKIIKTTIGSVTGGPGCPCVDIDGVSGDHFGKN